MNHFSRFSSPLLLVLMTLMLGTSMMAHQVITMIEPRSTEPVPATILSVATGAGLTSLVAAMQAIGGPLLAAVQNPFTKVTVFAPSDAVSERFLLY